MASSMLDTKILPSPIRAGLSGAADGIDRLIDQLVADHDFDFYLRQEVDDIFRTPIKLGVPFLAPKPFRLGDGDSLEADLLEGFFDFVELERLDDGLNFFHELYPDVSNCLRYAFRNVTRYLRAPVILDRVIGCRDMQEAMRMLTNGRAKPSLAVAFVQPPTRAPKSRVCANSLRGQIAPGYQIVRSNF